MSEVIQEVLPEKTASDFGQHLKNNVQVAPAPAPTPAPAPVIPQPVVEPETPKPVTEVPVPAPVTEAVAKPVTETTITEVAPAPVAAEAPKAESLNLAIDEPTKPSDAATQAADIYKVNAEKYESLTKNPQAKFVLDWIESGKDISNLPEVFKTVDYSKMDAKTLTENLGKHLNWTPEQLEAQMDYMETLSPYDAEKYRAQIAGDLNQIQKSGLEQSTEALIQDQAKQAQIMQQAVTDIEKEATGMIGKEVFGVVMNDQDARDFTEFVSGFNIYRADGTLNVPMLRNMWVGVKKLPIIQKEAQKTAAAQATIKTVEEFTRPSTNGAVASALPQPKQEPAPEQKASKALEAFMRGQ